MKDWFVKDSCIRVYDSGQEKEIAFLHSDYCDELKPCSEYPSVSLKGTDKFKDKNGIIHLHGSIHFERNSTPEEVIRDIISTLFSEYLPYCNLTDLYLLMSCFAASE